MMNGTIVILVLVSKILITLMIKMITLVIIYTIPGEATIPPPQCCLPAVPAVPGQSMTKGGSEK